MGLQDTVSVGSGRLRRGCKGRTRTIEARRCPVTDPRLHSTEPIDDELPFQEAEDVPGEVRPEEEDATVAPAAAERERHEEETELDKHAPPPDEAAGASS
jgi:hypothetical protein